MTRGRSRVVQSIAQRCLSRYFAGASLAEALRSRVDLARRGYWTTLGYWDRAGDDPREVLQRYLDAVAALAPQSPDYISVKAPALGGDIERCRRLKKECERKGVALHFDSLGPEWAQRTMDLIEALAPWSIPVGYSLPGRWRRSEDDARWAASVGIIPRVVKGQWLDPQDRSRDARRGFLAVVGALAGKASTLRIATHDTALARQAVQLARAAGSDVELELLYGLPLRPLVTLARREDLPIRIYVPYGTAWLPYSFSTLVRRPRTLLWIARDLLSGGRVPFPQLR